MIPEVVMQRWFGFQHAFDHPATLWIVLFVLCAHVFSGVVLYVLNRREVGAVADAWGRWKSWAILSALMIIPILLGAFWTVLGVVVLCLGCYREFARATGLMRHKLISCVVVLGILTLSFATLDHYDRLFFATAPLTVALIAIITVAYDQPTGFIQRVALGVFGFSLFGFSLSYVGAFINHEHYRPILLFLLLSVCLNDVYAYCIGRGLGRRKAFPQTSPGKTLAGCWGAILATTVTVSVAGHFVFQGTALDRLGPLLFLGVLISVLAQTGDLVLSSIKRDLAIKNIGTAIPGHGGLLDRFDSMVFVPPAVYHFLSLCLGPLGEDYPERIFSSLWMIGS